MCTDADKFHEDVAEATKKVGDAINELAKVISESPDGCDARKASFLALLSVPAAAFNLMIDAYIELSLGRNATKEAAVLDRMMAAGMISNTMEQFVPSDPNLN